MQRRSLVLCALVVVSLAQLLFAYPEIWELTGGNERGLGEGYNIRSQKQTGYPLFEYSGYTDSILVNGQRYAIPDETFGLGKMMIKNDSEVVIMESFEEFQKMKSRTWGISVGLSLYGVGVEVGLSRIRGQINGLVKNSSRSFNVATYLWHAFDLEVDWRDARLDQSFVDDVMRLPATYTQPIYRRFIEAYGTHFFDKVGFGCKWNYTVAFDRAMTEKSGAKWSMNQVGIAVTYSLGNFGLKVGMNFTSFKNTSHIDGTFQKNSNGNENLLGGDELLQSKGLEAWYPTCQTNRAILLEKSTLKPIAELIKDPSRKAAMITALKDYAAHP
jgi:hypothetical protein